MPSEPDTLTLRVAARSASVTYLRTAAVGFAELQEATAQAQQAVALAVTEAVTNVVMHAYRDRDATGGIWLQAGVDAERSLRVSVADDGVGLSSSPGSPGLGRGLRLIAQLCDSVEMLTDGGTTVVMRFDLARHDPVDTEVTMPEAASPS